MYSAIWTARCCSSADSTSGAAAVIALIFLYSGVDPPSIRYVASVQGLPTKPSTAACKHGSRHLSRVTMCQP